MQRRFTQLLVAALVLGLLAAFALLAPGGAVADRGNPTVVEIDPGLIPDDGAPEAVKSERVNVALTLRGDPIVTTYVALQAAGAGKAQLAKAQKDQKAKLEAEQKAVIPAIQSKASSAKVIATSQTLVNAVYVRVNRDQVSNLRSVPGVTSISLVRDAQHDLKYSVPYIGADRVATELGITGRGVRVAVIDTGIDYTHRNYGGPGTVQAYEVAASSLSSITATITITNPVTGVPVTTTMFPTDKIPGGYDFVGDTWTGQEADGPLTPDPDPLDPVGPGYDGGHGSHTSGIVGGFGVPNTSFNGSIPTSNDFDGDVLYHGVAPAVQLYAYKVCSSKANNCSGIAMIQAMEASADPNGDGDLGDHLDAFNMSIGSSFGGDRVTATAANNAVLAGVAAAVSAGNSGDVAYITGAPSIAERALSVASVYPPNQFTNTMDAVAPASIAGRKFLMAVQSWSPAITAPITGDVVYIGRACPGDTLLADPRGKIALAIRGSCAVSLKAGAASDAGAIAVVIYNNVAGELPPTFSYGGGNVTVPTVTLNNRDGALLRSTSGARVTISLEGGIPVAGYISGFSSRGPSLYTNGLKPDISAPGSNIVSTGAGSGDQPETMSGTSMAAPHIAGVLALLKQANPSWSAQEMSAAIVNTASPTVVDLLGLNPDNTPRSASVSLSRQGAGLVDAYKAATTRTLIWVPDAVASLSFGFQAVDGTKSITRQFMVANKDAMARTYNLSFAPFAPLPAGTTVSFSPSSVTVPAGGTATVTATLTIVAAGLKPYGMINQNAVNPTRLTDAEITGFVKATEQGGAGEAVTAPLYAVARPASAVTPPSGDLPMTKFGMEDATTVKLTNSSATAGNVEIFSLMGSDPNESDIPDQYDIQYVGVRSGLADTTDPTSQYVQFSVKLYGRPALGLETGFNVDIDANRDGTVDYIVFNADIGYRANGTATGQNGTYIYNAATNTVTGPFYYTIYYANGSDYILTVDGVDIGLTPTNQQFDFAVLATNWWVQEFPDGSNQAYVDYAPDAPGAAYTFNAAQPRFSTDAPDGGSLVVPGNGSVNVKVWANARGWLGGDRANRIGAQGLLLQYFDNATVANEAAALTVKFPFNFRVEEQTFMATPSLTGYFVNRVGQENFLGTGTMFSGIDNRPRTPLNFLGVTQFNLGAAGGKVEFEEAILDITGSNATYADPRLDNQWRTDLLTSAIDNSLASATQWAVANAPADAQLSPVLVTKDVAVGKTNTLTFDSAGRAALSDHVRTSGKATFRIGATPLFPVGMHIFGWQGATGANTKPPTLHALTVTQLP